MINGSPKGYFQCSRGVRQGYPLSPLIFCLAEDYLSHQLTQLFEDTSLVPMYASSRVRCPTHFFYADDILLFCETSKRNLETIRFASELYERLSGQIFIPEKSKLFFEKSVPPSLCNRITSIW